MQVWFPEDVNKCDAELVVIWLDVRRSHLGCKKPSQMHAEVVNNTQISWHVMCRSNQDGSRICDADMIASYDNL